MRRISVRSENRIEFIDVTTKVNELVAESGVEEGVCFIFTPHTTAAVTINENTDPAVVKDIIAESKKIVPDSSTYSHIEGNSPAHIKSSFFGPSDIVFVEKGELALGRWQAVYFCEFDGPRMRDLWVKVIPAWV